MMTALKLTPFFPKRREEVNAAANISFFQNSLFSLSTSSKSENYLNASFTQNMIPVGGI